MPRWRSLFAASLVAASFSLSGGCQQVDVVASRCAEDADCAAGQRCEGGACVDAAGRTAAFCDGSGPLLQVGDTPAECGGRVAERSFRFALCSCGAVVAGGPVRTDSFDSRVAPYRAPGGAGGSIGTNADLNNAAAWTVGGSLWSSGVGGWSSPTGVSVGGDLHLAGRLAVPSAEVARDAFIAGGVQADTLRVDGTLTLPSGVDVSVMSATATPVRAPVNVAPPCGCGPADRVDVRRFISSMAAENDNAALGLSADALAGVASPRTLDLPCGRYYLSRIQADAPLTLRATGRVALLVEGDLTVNRSFDIELSAPNAEVDLFIGGNVVSGGALSLAGADAPARARMYVGGAGTINLGAGATFAGNLYAPAAELVAAGPVEVFGALFVGRVSASGGLDLHYDQAVLSAGNDCPLPNSCTQCGDCPSEEACVNGACGACRDNRDCCAPLLCSGGRCRPELI